MEIERALTSLVWCPHPLLAASGREIFNIEIKPGESIAALLRRVNVDLDYRPVVIYVNDRRLDRAEWETVLPAAGDLILARALVQGGGDGNKTLRTLASIAVLVAAPELAAYYGFTGVAGSTAAALISVGGTLIINALLPPPMLSLSNAQGQGKESPTYSLSGGGNRPRPFEPLPLIIGTHRFWPDPDGKPYTDFIDGEQWLYQTFNLGLNGDDLAISDHKVGDTPLSSFADFDIGSDLQISSGNGQLTLFPANVDSLTVGVQLGAPANLVSNGNFSSAGGWTLGDGWIIRGGKAAHGNAGFFQFPPPPIVDGDISQDIATSSGSSYRVCYSLSGINQGYVTCILGGAADTTRNADGDYNVTLTAVSDTAPRLKFTSSDELIGSLDNVIVISEAAADYTQRTSSADATALAVDLVGLLFYAGDNGLQTHTVEFVLQYCATGSGAWVGYDGGTGIISISNSDRSQVRKTIRWAVTQGQYDVRIRRITADEENERYTSDFSWIILRSYQPDDGTYAYQKRVALRIRASGNLNGSLDTYNVLATASCEAWTGSAWSKTANSNPAWWFRWFAKGKTDANGQRLYGGTYSDADLDLDAIKDWGAWCTGKGLSVNLVDDRAISLLEVLQAIARCGRASVTWATGKLGVIWDADDEPVTAQFGMGNIIRNSFKVDYVTGQLADEIVVEFINPDIGYQPDTVRATVPGVTNPVNPAKVQIWGLADGTQAGREANLIAAAQYYRRRRITWEADFEAISVKRGSVTTLSHDLTQWDYSGRLEAGTTTVLTLNRAVPFTPSEQHYVGIRQPDGTYDIYDVVYQAGESATITLGTALPSAPDDDEPRDWLWFFGPRATPGKKVKILNVIPGSDPGLRQLIATDEDPDYYAAEDGTFDYVSPSLFGSHYPTVSDLRIDDSLILVGHAFAVTVSVSWSVAGDYGGAWVRWRLQGEKWQMLPSTPGRHVQFQAPAQGTLDIEVTAFNRWGKSGDNSRVSTAYPIVGDDDPMGNVTNFIAAQNGTLAILSWTEPNNVDRAGYEIRRQAQGNADWDTAVLLMRVGRVGSITTANIPPGVWTLLIKGFDHNDPPIWSPDAASDDIEMVNTNDIIDSQDYFPAWPLGTLSGFVKHWTGFLVPADQYPASDYGWELFDQAVPTPVAACSYEAPESDIGVDNNVRIWGKAESRLLPGETAALDPVFQLDSRLDAGAYDGFENWDIGDRAGRYFKARITLDTSEGIRAITGMSLIIDLLERDETWFDQNVPVGGLTLTFDQPFLRIPWISGDAYDSSVEFRVTDVNQSGGVFVSFTVKIFTTGTGTSVGGTARVIKAKGV